MLKEKNLKEFLKKLDKQRLIDLYLQMKFDKDMEIDQLQHELNNSVIFPKLEKDNAHKGYWYLYELDSQGNITYTSFKATEEEALARLEALKGDHK